MRKLIILAIFSILLGPIILVGYEAIFGSLTNVSNLVMNASPITIKKRLIFPSACSFSLNGWSKGSQDFAANEYLKIRSFDIHITRNGESKSIQVKNEHMNTLDFETESIGLLEINVNNYDSSFRHLEIFDAELSCTSSGQKVILVVSFACMVLGFLMIFILAARIIFRKLFK